MEIIKGKKEVTANTGEFSTRVMENDQGIIIDVFIRHGELIKTLTFWKDDFFNKKTICKNQTNGKN